MVQFLNENVPDIGGVGDPREGLPHRRRQEAVGQAPVSVDAGEDHPA